MAGCGLVALVGHHRLVNLVGAVGAGIRWWGGGVIRIDEHLKSIPQRDRDIVVAQFGQNTRPISIVGVSSHHRAALLYLNQAVLGIIDHAVAQPGGSRHHRSCCSSTAHQTAGQVAVGVVGVVPIAHFRVILAQLASG